MTIEDNEIVIIGSGSSILNYELGDTIDSFKEVVRINDFEIEGYEKHVGTKTTVWGRSNSNRTKDKVIDDSLSVVIASPVWNFKTVKDKMKLHKNSSCVSIDDSLHLERELGLLGRSHRAGGKNRGWPSTGLLIIYYFLKLHKTIYLHGFDFFKDDKGDARHYYNNKELLIDNTLKNHNSEEEKKWVIKKVKEKRIKILSECFG